MSETLTKVQLQNKQFDAVTAMLQAELEWQIANMAIDWLVGCDFTHYHTKPFLPLWTKRFEARQRLTQAHRKVEELAVPAELEAMLIQSFNGINGSARGAFGVAWDAFHNRKLEACWAVGCATSLPRSKVKWLLLMQSEAYERLYAAGQAIGVQVGGAE